MLRSQLTLLMATVLKSLLPVREAIAELSLVSWWLEPREAACQVEQLSLTSPTALAAHRHGHI